MTLWIHAFCLDEAKAKDEYRELVLGPLHWLNITWDFLNASPGPETDVEHIMVRDTSGFWYQVVELQHDTHSYNMEPNKSRGRYTDISIRDTPPEWTDAQPIDDWHRINRMDMRDPALRYWWDQQVRIEDDWLAQPDDE